MARILVNELASALSDKKKLNKKVASTFVNEMFYVIQKGLNDDRLVKVKGLGTFKIIEVDDRESVNVNTGERVLIEGHDKISFTPDALMKELVNKPFSQFETVVLNEGVDFADAPNDEPESVEPDSEESEASMAPLVDFVTEETAEEPQKPVMKEEPEVKAAPVVKEEPVVKNDYKPEPVSEKREDSVVTPQVEPEKAEIAAEAETPIAEAVEETIPDADEEETSSFNWKKWLLPALFCIVVFAGGYWIGTSSKQQPEVKTEKPVAEPAPAVKVPEEKVEPASEKVIESTPEEVAEPAPEVSEQPASPTVSDKTEPVVLDKYEQMDIRIRTGAYRITGLDHMEKIRPNDDLTRICKRTIGAGMECYLEAFNGMTPDAELKVGQEIKIPKLELKKKRAK